MIHRNTIERLITETTRENQQSLQDAAEARASVSDARATDEDRFEAHQRLHRAKQREHATRDELARLEALLHLAGFQGHAVVWEHLAHDPAHGVYGTLKATTDTGKLQAALDVRPAAHKTATTPPYHVHPGPRVLLETERCGDIDDAHAVVTEWAANTLGVDVTFGPYRG
ncbi:hypothetical protein ABT332_13555 [Saccharomonospora azurea]|uniref:hypothetical protein n=1 Tax=Saccharomonospora azurea TaxID=40988 RepID=UPI0033176B41